MHAAFCYACMSAEIKELKTIYYDKYEAFTTYGYRNWRYAIENFRVYEESVETVSRVYEDCHNFPCMTALA